MALQMNIALVGIGGFSRETMPILLRIYENKRENVNFFYVDLERIGDSIGGIQVIEESHFFGLPGDKYFNVGIADPKIRQKVVDRFVRNDCKSLSIFADNFVQHGANSIGEGCIFSYFSSVTSDATVGKYFHCNIYSYVAHDSVIGDFVTFAPKVCCNGNVVIEDYAYIGTGAVIKQGTPNNPLVIGENAIVGMGAVVTRDVPPGSTVAGNPARAMR